MPFELTPEGYQDFSTKILEAEGDQATLTSLLADMQTTFTDAIAKDASNTEKVTTVEAENERLRKANMDLFLRVGSQMNKGGESGQQQEPEKKVQSTKDYMNSYFEKLDNKN